MSLLEPRSTPALDRLAVEIRAEIGATLRSLYQAAVELGLEFDVDEMLDDPFPLMERVCVATGDLESAALIRSAIDAVDAGEDE